MNQTEFFKKLNRLNPFELSISVVGFLFFTLCVIYSLFYFDYGVGNGGLTSAAGLRVWMGIRTGLSAKNEELGFVRESSRSDDYECDYFDGKWVWDETYPLYDSKDCLFSDGGFRCLENGRPDNAYTKWRWQPNKCDLPRFDAKLMLEKLRNKRLVYVGDSIGRNQWESLLCMLSSAVPNKTSIYEVNGNPITKHMGYLVFMFRDYNCTIEYYRAPFLVVQSRPPRDAPKKVRLTLRVDQLDWSSHKYKDADVLIFNSGHWWNYEKTIRGGCYFQEGNEVKMNMSAESAYRRSIETLVKWVENEVNINKTSVFFRSYAPVHFSGGDWKHGGICHMETLPDLEAPFLPQTWHHFSTVNSVLLDHANTSRVSKVNLLNVTSLTFQRKDGHASLYYTARPVPMHRQDCSHWCLPGVPDTWNELLFAMFLKKHPFRSTNSTIASQAEA